MQLTRSISIVFACSLILAAQGQGLEGQFDGLSAKERSRIAKAEEEGAIQDSAYQALMAHAESLFREQRFPEALDSFTKARDLRPYNVYPRVKIQDLQALIAKREQEVQVEPEPALPEPQPTPERSVPQSVDPAPVQPSLVEPSTAPAPSVVKPPTVPPRVLKVEQAASRSAELPALEPDEERIYKEGRAIVVERSRTVEGRPVLFRKVMHPWGEVMYFRDGAAIPERIWVETFGVQ